MTHKVTVGSRNYRKTISKTSTPARFVYSLSRPDSGTIILTRGDGEWSMAETLDLEAEYSVVVITHETLHRVMARFGEDQKNQRLNHLGDICALAGF